jgi:hypothetical protein
VPLVTDDGRRVRFYDDLVKDKKVVPHLRLEPRAAESDKVTQNLGAIQKLFGTRVGQDMFLYSIARSPERDTPQAMQRWAVWSGAGPGWRFLTGSRADIETLRHGLGFASDDPAEDANRRTRSALVRYGVEPEMRWAHCQSRGTARVLAHSMLLDFRRGAGRPAVGDRTAAGRGGGAGQAPVWNCRLLLAGSTEKSRAPGSTSGAWPESAMGGVTLRKARRCTHFSSCACMCVAGRREGDDVNVEVARARRGLQPSALRSSGNSSLTIAGHSVSFA